MLVGYHCVVWVLLSVTVDGDDVTTGGTATMMLPSKMDAAKDI